MSRISGCCPQNPSVFPYFLWLLPRRIRLQCLQSVPLTHNQFIEYYAEARSQKVLLMYNCTCKEFSNQLQVLKMSWVNPWLTIEEIIVFRCFGEKGIVEIDHALSYQGEPIFSHSISLPTFNSTLFIHKFNNEFFIPKSIRFCS